MLPLFSANVLVADIGQVVVSLNKLSTNRTNTSIPSVFTQSIINTSFQGHLWNRDPSSFLTFFAILFHWEKRDFLFNSVHHLYVELETNWIFTWLIWTNIPHQNATCFGATVGQYQPLHSPSYTNLLWIWWSPGKNLALSNYEKMEVVTNQGTLLLCTKTFSLSNLNEIILPPWVKRRSIVA